MKFGGDFLVPGDEDFRSMPPWKRVTPQKPLPLKPHHIMLNPQGNHLPAADYQHEFGNVQLGDNYSGMGQAFSPIVQFPRNFGFYSVGGGLAPQNGMTNHIAGSYPQLLGSDSSSWNDGLFPQLLPQDNTAAVYVASANMNYSRNVDMAANAPPTPNLHPQVANKRNNSSSFMLTNRNCNNGSYHSSQVMSRPVVVDFPSRFDVSQGHSNVTNWLLNNKNQSSSANLLSNGDRSPHISQNVFPMPLRPSYDLNLNFIPGTEADTTSCAPSQLQFTPYRANSLENNQRSSIQTWLTGESTSKKNEKQVDFFMSTGDLAIENHGAELLQNIVESASATIPTPYKENKDPDHESERVIDLNQTPPHKTPKRRKHRPKVVIEGKPKRTPKPAAEKNAEPKEPRTGKRKYTRKIIQKESSSQVADGTSQATYQKEPRTGKRKYSRKNIQKESSSQVADDTSEATYRNAGIGAKTCRRVLDFDLDVTTVEKQGKAARINQSKMKSSNLIDLENEVPVEKQTPETTSYPSPSLSHLRSNYIILPEGGESTVLLATRGDTQINNLHDARIHADSQYESAPMLQPSYAEGLAKHAMQAKTNGENHEKTKESANQDAFQSAIKSLSPANEGRKSKREYCHNIQQTRICSNYLPSSLLCEETFEFGCHQESSSSISKSSHKKQRVDTGYLSIHDMPLKVIPVEDDLGRSERKRANDANSNGFAAALNHTILHSYIGSNIVKERENTGVNKCTSDRFIEPIASGHNLPKQQMPIKSNSFKDITQVLSFSTNSTTDTCNQLVSSPPKKSSRRGKRQELQTQEHKSATKQTVRYTVLESALSSTEKRLQEQNFLHDHQQSFTKTSGLLLKTIYPSFMDDIIYRFSVLSINGSCNESMDQERNALVPYKGDGAIVPYEGAEYIKKRKPRPKVELDSETNRIWNLLMGKEGIAGTEGPDKQKQKYWEDERKVFQGRVDSFIARMHLVQGDRRFSRWKGSVVDSVIGVFLTQNVSDHLSSSAFMSLAARFPLKSTSKHQTQDKVGTDILVKEPELCIPIPDDATKSPENIIRQPIYNPVFMAPYASAEHLRDGVNSERNIMEAHSQCLEEEFVSSQDSFGSSVTQGTAENRSYSASNSETEDPTARRQTNKVCCNSAYPPMDKDIIFQDFYHEVQGIPLLDDGSRQKHSKWEQLKTRSGKIDDFRSTYSVTNPINLDSRKMRPSIPPSTSNHIHMYQSSGELEPFGLESFSEESISSYWPSTAPKVNMEKYDSNKSFRNIELSGTVVSSSVEQNTLWRFQEPAIKDPYDALRLPSTNQPNYSQPRSYEYYQPSCNGHQYEGNQTFQTQVKKNSFIEPVKHSQRLPEKKYDNMQHVPNVNQLNTKSSNARDSTCTSTVNNGSVCPSAKEKYSHERSQNETSKNISRGRKKKSESDKKNTVDWDNLRKQVFADGRKEDRNKDVMDSLDYEALINADVKEISDAIRERGMNNMLAERIQEFLKRVVKDHGSINLEWLRDVPPDQAKDYLLSIRGLGLKSVECVRLLTLQHLAFPVDTNVGRIAVRLGWVPLQTLPESLQLHLLELYPMLDSIQKYLWPRLCKLDQLTLYELHYQMITFGKVFCTKSKPNCNACPMRGECRHFASAFASARLALPGPGEKSIVSSTSSPVAEKNPAVAGNILSLPPPENYLLQKVGAYRSEPIIEEPASPEQEFTNLSHSEIEDLLNEEEYDDDPDDITHINISMEQLTDTLQDHMQNNLDLKDGDLSKALVALNPAATSLPTPKLKNVSRLRTEHQVYELPDSHPLLEGMDRREPDDPAQPKNVTPLQSPSGDATACVTSAAPSEETTSRKKPRLGWGEGLAKYEKKKVDPADVVMNKDGDVCQVGNVEPVQYVSPHLADKSPRLMVLTDCASPATPSSVACSSSPGVEEKSFGKAAGVDNDINLYRSPGPEFQSHQEGFSFNLEKLDYNSLANVSSSLHELLQSDDPSPMDCSTVRPTAMNKLLIWKGDISKVLEVTESEIDLLENELKMLNSDSRDTCQCPAASSSLPVEGSDTSGKEQATAIKLVTRPAPLIVCSSGDADLEKLALGNGEQGESCGLKDQDMDSPGTATSKFVDRLPLLNVASSGNSSGCAENQDLVQTVEREAECLTSGKDEEKSDPSVCGNSGREIVTPVSNGFGICASVVDTLCDSIFSSNKETASRVSDIFNKLLPKDNCKVNISGLGISSSWKNDSLLKEKFRARKQHLRFMERVITLKYKAHQQLWKEDVRLLSELKYRPKSHKKYDLGLRNSSNGYQKHRSSIRSRFSTPAGNLSLVPTKEVEKFANKVLCDSQVKLYRNSLKMPALILDKKEKIVTRFVSSNGLIEDPCAVEKERALINPWTPEEKEAFIEKLAVFGKDFKKIASFFDHKTTADCVELYYKHHKSAAFQKTKKKPDTSKLGKSAANTYMINPGTKWNREVNAASLDILGAASVMAAQADGSTRNRTGRLILGGYKNMKTSQGDDATVERSCSFDVIGDERETAAADVLAGICGSLSSEAVSSCITSSIDPGDGYREWKCQKVDSQARRPLTPDVLQTVDDETCSDDSCGEMDPTDWTDEEKSSFIQAVSSHGKDFAMISRCVRTRSQNQCKVFFSKARKCLGLDLVHPRRGNEGASIVDDANGGESDTEDACVVEAGSGISSDKSSCDTNEDLPLSVMDMDHEKTKNLQCAPLGSVENNVKGEVDLLDKKALRSSDALEMEDRPKLVFDDLTNIMDVADRLSESVPAQRSEAFSADVDAVIDNVAEKGSLVAESVIGEGMSSDLPKLEGQDERCNTDTSGCGLQVSVHDSNSSGSASDMAAEGSCSGLAAECLQQVSVEFNSMQKSLVNSLLHENLLATAISVPENSAVVEHGKSISQDRLSSTSAKQEDRDKQSSSIRGDDVHKHLPGLPVLRNVDPAHVLKGYPLHLAMGKEINGHTSCGNLSEVKHLSKPDGDRTGHKPKDCILQFGNCKPRSPQVDFPHVHQKIERRSDTTKAHSWSSSDTDKPSRNGDVKLFGKILTSTSKSGSSIHENEEKGSHTHNLSNKSSNLKFSGDHNLDGNSGVLKFDSSNYAGIENVPRRNYSFWEGNKVQNGHPSFPDSALLLAKYPAAFGNFPTSSSKLEQQPLAVVRNDGHVNGASVFPSREISSSSSSGSGIVDYHQVFSRHRDGGAKVPPFTVDVKQRQETFDVSRRNGFESVSSLQQQGRGIVGMNGVNVVGRGGIMVGGPCTGVSDPVAAIRMHYAKTEQYGAQGIIKEEESWRGKGDIGR